MKPWKILVVGIPALVIVGLIVVLLFPLAPVTAAERRSLVGVWRSAYLEGQIEITLRGDGSYHETLSNFPSLPASNSEGLWSVDNGTMTLSPFVDFKVAQDPSGGGSIGRSYTTYDHTEIRVQHDLFGGIVMKEGEAFNFSKAAG